MGNEHSKTKDGKINGKHKNESVNGVSANITSNGLELAVNGDTIVPHDAEPLSLNLATESTDYIVVESDCKPADAPVISEIPEAVIQTEEVKESNEDQTDVSPPAIDLQLDTDNLQQEPESVTVPESVTPDPSPEEEKAPESDDGNSQPVENQEESKPEENPVMNFFKTLMTPKVSKKDSATPDARKDQKEIQPAATTTVAQVSEPPAAPKGMSVPPPPPPEPPKMEIKGEAAAKPVKAAPKDEAKAKEVESPKGKSVTAGLSSLFRSKVLLGFKAPKSKGASASGAKAPAQTAAVKVDPSKAGTLEAAAKPEPPPPAQEEKKTDSKLAFFSLFKSKVLLDHMTTKVQAASTSGVRLLRKTAGLAADPKKATPPPAAAAAETTKAKEEPKAAAAKSPEAAVDNKPASAASQAGDDANVPKKLEKRNSIQLFFKILGQKRNSTDAGVQTEPVPAAPGAEKAK